MVGLAKTKGRGGERRELQFLVSIGHLSASEADEIGETLDLLDDLVQLGALSVAQGNAIIAELADNQAQQYVASGEWAGMKIA